MVNNEGDEVMAQAVNFTSDDDFKELQDKDETTEITGFVDEVHAPNVVGKTVKYDLFKFVLNNGGRKRIVCLVWGKSLIQDYVDEIKVGRILHIEGAITKAVAANYFKESANLVPFELLVKQDATTIKYLGHHDMNPVKQFNIEEAQEVDFSTVGKAHGLIKMQGNIKMKFVKSLNKRKGEYYGCGSITNGSAKVTIHIANYSGLVIEKGILVKIIGEIDEEAALTTIICRDDSAVIPVPDGARMSDQELARGVKSPKRGAD